jgi:hypothetical protein
MPKNEENDAKIIGNNRYIREWVTGNLGLDDNRVGEIRVNMKPGQVVTAEVTIFLTVRDLRAIHRLAPRRPSSPEKGNHEH